MKRHLVVMTVLALTAGGAAVQGLVPHQMAAIMEPGPVPPEGGGDVPDPGDGVDPNSPSAQQVDAAINSVNDTQPNTRDAAEERLASLGPTALPALKEAAGRNTGFKRAAAEAAIFRISNNIKPREAIQNWAKKAVDGLRTKNERVCDDTLTELFPHHLFYVLAFGDKAKLPANVPGLKTRTVVAMAADGKIQLLTEDAGLAHFLKVEGGELKSAGERARMAEIAVVLACVREPGGTPAMDEIKTSEEKGLITSEGANTKATVTVAMTVTEGHVATIAVQRGPAPPRKNPDPPEGNEAPEPAATEGTPPAPPAPPAVEGREGRLPAAIAVPIAPRVQMGPAK